MNETPENAALADVPSTGWLATLLHMSADERAVAYVEANRWQWPDRLIEYKPAGFDAMTQKEKFTNADFNKLMEGIKSHTSNFERSRAWWIIALGRTKEQHAAWWTSGRGNLANQPAD